MSKVLIAFYSRKGMNYTSSGIKNLPVGNTELLANKIKELLPEADMFHIDTVKTYPEDYTECTEVSKKELHDNARPELTAKVENMEQYDTIILGYPCWWGTMPMGCWTFLESYSFDNKTIIPFCTNEGSGNGSSVSDIKKLCPNAKVTKGTAVRGTACAHADKEAKSIAEQAK